jgi:methylenetetrahydrofolate dehydrogenase (NADP+)/methenyltetrahydrofolate cyclohydrolase
MHTPSFLHGNIIDGKALAQSLLLGIKEKIAKLSSAPALAVIIVGNHPSSAIYVQHKKRMCEDMGITCTLLALPEEISEEALRDIIGPLNISTDVHGILLQLPLPSHLDRVRIIECINPLKDVDGLTSDNQGLLFCGRPRFIPCTPLGCLRLLSELTDISGKTITVIGRSHLVGRPLAALLTNMDATVTLAHRYTLNLEQACKDADILITAVGKPGLIQSHMVKEGAIILDVGITRIGDEIFGDVDFKNVAPKCKAITPVPGGIGPLTIASLMENMAHAAYIQEHAAYIQERE